MLFDPQENKVTEIWFLYNWMPKYSKKLGAKANSSTIVFKLVNGCKSRSLLNHIAKIYSRRNRQHP